MSGYRRTELTARLHESWHRLGRDEREIIIEVAEGLASGRILYGELNLETDDRDFAREAMEEVRDALVYAAAALIRQRRGLGDEPPGEL